MMLCTTTQSQCLSLKEKSSGASDATNNFLIGHHNLFAPFKCRIHVCNIYLLRGCTTLLCPKHHYFCLDGTHHFPLDDTLQHLHVRATRQQSPVHGNIFNTLASSGLDAMQPVLPCLQGTYCGQPERHTRGSAVQPQQFSGSTAKPAASDNHSMLAS